MSSDATTSKNHNKSRFSVYKAVAIDFVDGEAFDPNELAHLLTDLRWNEVPRAFSSALMNASRRGPIRANLGESFDGLLQQVAFTSFGSVERRVLQPWFLENIDFFFVAMLDGLLLLNVDNTKLRQGHGMPVFLRALDAMFAMLESAKQYMSLENAVGSPGVHTLIAACSSTTGSFLKNGIAMCNQPCDDDPACKRDLTLAHVLLMDRVAAFVLADGDREIETWDKPFGQFLGSRPWTLFAKRCMRYATPTFTTNHRYARPTQMFLTNLVTLESEFRKAFELRRSEKHSIEIYLEQEKMMENVEESEPLKPVNFKSIHSNLLHNSPAPLKKRDADVLFKPLQPPSLKSNMPLESGMMTDSKRRNGCKRLRSEHAQWAELPQELLALILYNHIDSALVDLDNEKTTSCLLGMRLVSKGVKALTESYVGLQTFHLNKDATRCMDGICGSFAEVSARARSFGLSMVDVILLGKHHGPVAKIDGWTLPRTPLLVPNLRWFLEVRHEARKRHGEKMKTTKPDEKSLSRFSSKMEIMKAIEPHIWSTHSPDVLFDQHKIYHYDVMANAAEVEPSIAMRQLAGV